jgi:hypothetical protein
MFTPAPIFSYIDPVSGVILLQILIGGCIGGFVFVYTKIGGGLRRFLHPCRVRSKTEIRKD